ncbi:uncharacterized protein LOC129192740 [Dunckerocampus dactyliophorus]|uniref:uncharacterized protein LOC129192740 n=1 Tax=Dunckerocampus dactyliophorus TaxID=161453 RepID=UPI0024052C0E|nr:uncharacterized protein LOC129192740 [Dunckerocampus dactyliophorus]
MAYRRRQHLIPDHSDGGQTSNMEQLAFKYMEMCKVESSTDSDSEISPRWSDTSTMECVSSAPESGTLRRTLPEPAGRHGCYSLFLDPYDGSSEDSDDMDAPSRQTRQQGKGGGGRFSRKSRRFILQPPPDTGFRQLVKTPAEQQHLVDVQMKCTEGSEVWLCELVSLSSHADLYGGEPVAEMSNGTDIKAQLGDPASTSSQRPESSSDRSPGSTCNLRVLFKRKLAVPAADGLEPGPGHRKRQCVFNMEEEEEAGDSAWEKC